MAANKKRIAVLFGGRSPEHDVSIVTGLQVMDALDPALFEVIPVYVSVTGQWWTGEALRQRSTYLPGAEQLRQLTAVSLNLNPSERPHLVRAARSFLQSSRPIEFDVAVPAFHGLIGEDGRIQGLLEAAGVPYSGMRTLASALFMDKAATKHFLTGLGIPQLPFHEIRRPDQGLLITPAELEGQLAGATFPCCVKPSHLGSSIGVARVDDWQTLSDVLPAIFRYDDTAILEPFVDNLVEYNVAVRRDKDGIVTSAIERPKHASDLLDFKAKYLSGSNKGGGGAKMPGQASQGMLSLTRDINPNLPRELEHNIRTWAVSAFEHAAGTGAPRIDFLCNAATDEVWLNEINPCPGSFGYFLWEAAEKPVLFTQLLEQLIDEALDLHDGARLPVDPTPQDARLFSRRS